jgi:hypothetical protein
LLFPSPPTGLDLFSRGARLAFALSRFLLLLPQAHDPLDKPHHEEDDDENHVLQIGSSQWQWGQEIHNGGRKRKKRKAGCSK